MSASHRSGLLSRALRRLLPGAVGAEACDELDRQRAERRVRQGALAAWFWHAAHLLRPDTWALARALRRRTRKGGSGAGAGGVSLLDVKLGIRMLFKHPGLTLVSGLAVAVSIAVGVGCFSFFQDFVLRPQVPLAEGERVVSLGLRNDASNGTERRLLHDFVAWRAELASVEDVGAWREVSRNLVAPEGSAEPVRIAEMSAAGFRVARVPPLLGRPLIDEDEVEGAPPVIVIGYDIWQSRFDGAPDVIGRSLQLGREPHVVVGVMPEGFAFPLSNDLWTPLRWDPSDHEPLEGSGRAFAFGRLAPGVTLPEAQAEMAVLTRRRAAELPETHEHLRGQVMPYTDTHTGMDDARMVWLMGALALVFMTLILLVPFVNVAILVYARTAKRSGEIALRNALGASRRRIVVQLFVEALVLACIAAVAGVALALYGLERVQDLLALEFGGTPFWARKGRDPAAVGYALGLTVLAAVVAGVIPGLKATGRGVQGSLARMAGGNGMRLGGTWTALIIVQVGTTVAFVPPAVSLAWQGIGQGIVEPTFRVDDLLAVGMAESPASSVSSADDEEASRGRIADMLRRLEEEPAVAALTYASQLPGSAFTASTLIEVEDVPPPGDRAGHRVGSLGVAEGFFDALGIEIVAGRGLRRGDADADATPVIVNGTFVRRILREANPVGRRLRFVQDEDGAEPASWHEIVGVVGDLTTHPVNPANVEPRIFTPLPPAEQLSRLSVILRVPSSPDDFAPRLRRLSAAADPTIRLEFVTPLADFDDPLRTAMRMLALGIGIAVLSVLLLATAGVYALMSFNVTQRRREIGIRSALGADPRHVLTGIFSRAAAQLGLGAVVGLAGALFLEQTIVRQIDLGPRPGVGLLLLVAALMVGVGMLASVGPARRGLAIEPSDALRES